MPACYTQRCHQGRQPCPTPYACSGLKTTCGGESVDNGLPAQMYEPRFRLSLRGVVWIGSFIACGLLWAAADYLLR